MTKTDLLQENIRGEIIQFLKNYYSSAEFEVLPLAGDASNRKYFRIVCDEESTVLMDWEPISDPESYPFLSVHKHFKKHSIKVPKILSMDTQTGLMLLEDLGDLTLERKFWESNDQQTVLPFYKLALDELLKIHYSATADFDKDCTAFTTRFTVEKLLWEMNYGKTHLLEGLLKTKASDTEETEIQKVFTEICTLLFEQEPVICHRDYHSRNVMLKLGKLRVIDFQDARLGPKQYDLVSLLEDSYVDLGQDIKNRLLNYYIEKAQQDYKAQFSREDFDRFYKLQLIQRCFKACGSFASFYNLRGDTRYVGYIQPTIEKVCEVLAEFPEYKVFAQWLDHSKALKTDYKALCTE